MRRQLSELLFIFFFVCEANRHNGKDELLVKNKVSKAKLVKNKKTADLLENLRTQTIDKFRARCKEVSGRIYRKYEHDHHIELAGQLVRAMLLTGDHIWKFDTGVHRAIYSLLINQIWSRNCSGGKPQYFNVSFRVAAGLVAEEVSKLFEERLDYLHYYCIEEPMSGGGAGMSTMLLADTLLDLAQAEGFTPATFPSDPCWCRTTPTRP
jgi:hypothetical protein